MIYKFLLLSITANTNNPLFQKSILYVQSMKTISGKRQKISYYFFVYM